MVQTNGGAGSPQSNTFWEWKSPLPYIFISLGLAFGIILVAIIVLACSLHKQSSGGADGDEKSGSAVSRSAEMSPSFIVVMAGDAKPTHLAIPLPSSFIDKAPS
ncbi:PREDICTED: protein GLUTAMINE DUMPER 2-like [Ipomoea nil]|uniref:protein GLUTAMINE DUMPER 2-like n=1 Tax=Ipomoea nil TaxID=35883 RepID=UPI000900CE70|nr:PREDICTED: protein GLUTAMINE DUMPER 2-like [Ipomoea nil]